MYLFGSPKSLNEPWNLQKSLSLQNNVYIYIEIKVATFHLKFVHMKLVFDSKRYFWRDVDHTIFF